MAVQLTILGSSGAVPAFSRFPSSQLLVMQNRHFLIDCGEGAQMQLMKVNASWHKISHVFISHLHGDHYLGLMGLLFTMHLNRRENDLHLYAFRGLDEIILAQLKYSQSVLSYQLVFHELRAEEDGMIFEDDAVEVFSFSLIHKIPCKGFLFREKPGPRKINKDAIRPGMLLQHMAQLKTGADIFSQDGTLLYKNEDYTLPPAPPATYAYCSDTAWHPPLAEILRGVDVLYHEATFMEAEKNKASETKHSTAAEAARIAREAGVGKLLIGHFSARYRELDNLLNEAKAVFPNTELATECCTFEW
ncbi:MAG: ribonuclease Z [Bacteroidota bacterium]